MTHVFSVLYKVLTAASAEISNQAPHLFQKPKTAPPLRHCDLWPPPPLLRRQILLTPPPQLQDHSFRTLQDPQILTPSTLQPPHLDYLPILTLITRNWRPRPQPHPHPQDPSQLLYPVASSGRGFLSRPVAMPATRPSPRPPFVFPYLDQGQGNPGFVRANHFAHVFLGPGPGSAGNASSGGVMAGVVKGIPVPPSHPQKVGPPSASISDNNGHKDLRDKNKDDTFAIMRDRKVRISENASLYTLCRSWLRNGFPEETQPQYLDAAKSLPRPLPVAAQVVDSPDKKSGDKEEEDEDESSVENLSEKELLQRHIKRAKRVRSRSKDTEYLFHYMFMLVLTSDNSYLLRSSKRRKTSANYKIQDQTCSSLTANGTCTAVSVVVPAGHRFASVREVLVNTVPKLFEFSRFATVTTQVAAFSSSFYCFRVRGMQI
ncbi:hypothetical protein Sango_1589000 [Sesamum angolense]|uniref:Uncharacterized protein n=1 Tax=Sesamum angolense TaxID=2727404 RepID=A0AAE1WQ83_9LAMI|nr:hypothetical protein Sango_1589000 [Sesamum angolense]